MRYTPVGWRWDSFRHSLAARGISTRSSFAVPKSLQLRDVSKFKYGPPEPVVYTPVGEPQFGKYGEEVILPPGSFESYEDWEEQLPYFVTPEDILTPDEDFAGTMLLSSPKEMFDPYNKELFDNFIMKNKEIAVALANKENIDISGLDLSTEEGIEEFRQMIISRVIAERQAKITAKKQVPKDFNGKTISRVTDLYGNKALVLPEDFYYNMSRDEQGKYMLRMLKTLPKDGLLTAIASYRDPVYEFKQLPVDVQEKYIEQLFIADMNNKEWGKRAQDTALAIDANLHEDVKTYPFASDKPLSGSYPIGARDPSVQTATYPVSGGYQRNPGANIQEEIDVDIKIAKAQEDYDKLLASGGSLKDFGSAVNAIASILNPMHKNRVDAIAVKRAKQIEAYRYKNNIDELLASKQITPEEYNKLVVDLEEAMEEGTVTANSIIRNAARMDKKVADDMKMELTAIGGGKAIYGSIARQIPALANLSLPDFMQKAAQFRANIKGTDVRVGNDTVHPVANRWAAVLSPKQKDDLLRNISAAEDIVTVTAAQRNATKPKSAPKVKEGAMFSMPGLYKYIKSIRARRSLEPGKGI